jgi:hypothetical protein
MIQLLHLVVVVRAEEIEVEEQEEMGVVEGMEEMGAAEEMGMVEVEELVVDWYLCPW